MSRESSTVVVLWAFSERYVTPQMVNAWSASLDESYPEAARQMRDEAEEWFLAFGDESDGPWRFWTTIEFIPWPAVPESEEVED